MSFLISATDISGSITLRRETAAVKKAAELAEAGYRDVAITAPDGRLYPSETFHRLLADGWPPEGDRQSAGSARPGSFAMKEAAK